MSRHPTSTNSPFLARATIPTGVCSLELRGYGVARQSTANSEGHPPHKILARLKLKPKYRNVLSIRVSLCKRWRRNEREGTTRRGIGC